MLHVVITHIVTYNHFYTQSNEFENIYLTTTRTKARKVWPQCGDRGHPTIPWELRPYWTILHIKFLHPVTTFSANADSSSVCAGYYGAI